MSNLGMKACSKCGVPKDETEFYRRKTGKRHSWCVLCIKVDSSTRNQATLVKRREQERTRRENQTPEQSEKRRVQSSANYKNLKLNPEKFKEKMERDHFWRLKRTLGITKEEYLVRLLSQGGSCAICKEPPADGHHLCVDHEHVSGHVRGLLCKYCNLALGNIKDSLRSAESLVEYLKRHSS